MSLQVARVSALNWLTPIVTGKLNVLAIWSRWTVKRIVDYKQWGWAWLDYALDCSTYTACTGTVFVQYSTVQVALYSTAYSMPHEHNHAMLETSEAHTVVFLLQWNITRCPLQTVNYGSTVGLDSCNMHLARLLQQEWKWSLNLCPNAPVNRTIKMTTEQYGTVGPASVP